MAKKVDKHSNLNYKDYTFNTRNNITEIIRNIDNINKESNENFDKIEIAWRFTYIDRRGPFKFTFKELNYYLKEIIKFEKMTKEMIVNKGHSHPIPVSKLQNKERMRLKELDLHNASLFQLDIKTPARLFGFFTKNLFNIIWLDKKHEVYKCK